MFLLYIWSNKCSLGEHERLSKTFKILLTTIFWTVVYIFTSRIRVDTFQCFWKLYTYSPSYSWLLMKYSFWHRFPLSKTYEKDMKTLKLWSTCPVLALYSEMYVRLGSQIFLLKYVSLPLKSLYLSFVSVWNKDQEMKLNNTADTCSYYEWFRSFSSFPKITFRHTWIMHAKARMS